MSFMASGQEILGLALLCTLNMGLMIVPTLDKKLPLCLQQKLSVTIKASYVSYHCLV